MNTGVLLTGLLLLCAAAVNAAPTQTDSTRRFQFGPGQPAPGFVQISPTDVFTDARGYGREPGGTDSAFSFSVTLPEGNYAVTVTLGSKTGTTSTTVKAESRRLLLERVDTKAGQLVTRAFTVNIRTPQIAGGGAVHLKPREVGSLNWDTKLTLEFLGSPPGVNRVVIAPAPAVPTVFLMGDSTVTDQPGEPYCAWGQMLPRFFTAGVAVANYAESGESLRSTLAARRLDKVLSVLKPGDYVFFQFGHNDQKEHGAGVGAFTTYKADLLRFASDVQKKGGLPVFVTSMNRRRFDAAGHLVPTLGDYPDAVRQAAKEANVPLIDLNAMSKTLFEAMGPDGTLKAFVHYPANTFPGQTVALKDDTHFNSYGAYELAQCVVNGIRAGVPGLVKFLAPDAPAAFDPAHPDPVSAWNLPASPAPPAAKPDGS